MAYDSYYNQRTLLLHCNGPNASTVITDNSTFNRTVTAVGNAQISTAQSKWGGAALLLDGTGDYLSVPDSTSWAYGAGNLTNEAWVWLDPTWGSQGAIFSQRLNNSVNAPFWFGITAARMLRLIAASSTSTVLFDISGATALSTSTWHYVAVVRNGATWTVYLNAASEATTSNAGTLYDSTDALTIGGDTNANYFKGYIDDVRLAKGVADTIALPTEQFPDVGYPDNIGTRFMLPATPGYSTQASGVLVANGHVPIHALNR